MNRLHVAWAVVAATFLQPSPGRAGDGPASPPGGGSPGQALVREVKAPRLLRAFAISPDLRTLAGSDGEKRIFLWNGQTGALRKTVQLSGVGIDELVCSANSSLVAALNVTADGYQVVIVNALDGSLRGQWKCASRPDGITFTADGSLLAYAAGDAVYLVDLRAGTERHLAELPMDSLAFSPDGSVLAGATGYRVTLWDVTTLQPKRTLQMDPPTPLEERRLGRTHRIAFSPDGKLLATSPTRSGKGLLRIFDLETGQLRQRLVAHEAPVVHLLFTADGTSLISTTAIPDPVLAGLGNLPGAAMRLQSEVSMWEPASGKLRKRLVGKEMGPGALLHPDGKTLVTFDVLDGGLIQLWDLDTGAELNRPALPRTPAALRQTPRIAPAITAPSSPSSRPRKSKP